MKSDLQASVEISLSKSACLLLFELLTTSYEAWRRLSPNDDADGAMTIEAAHISDRKALWQLEGALERTLPELFSSNYRDLIAESRDILTGESPSSLNVRT